MGSGAVVNMFFDTKHTKWYMAIIMHRQQVPMAGYVEKHHIVPRSMGGNNDSTNIVKLTPREHFVCHRLLVRMTHGRDKHKMAHALWMMASAGRNATTFNVSSRSYELFRRLKSDASKGNRWAAGKHSQERIEQNRRAQRIAQNDPATKAKLAGGRARRQHTKLYARQYHVKS